MEASRWAEATADFATRSASPIISSTAGVVDASRSAHHPSHRSSCANHARIGCLQGGKDGGKDGGKGGKDGGKAEGRGKGKKGGKDGKGFGKGGRKGSGDQNSVDMSKQECKNDYSQHYVNCGERPQNSVRETGMETHFDQFPKLRELIELKDKKCRERTTDPMWMQCDLKTFPLASLPCKFDVVLIDPPWAEYQRRVVDVSEVDKWTRDEIAALRIEDIAATPSFIFLWCGSMEGLQEGRVMLTKWGYRRCEDIVWVKTTHDVEEQLLDDPSSILKHTTEHCLMGIKGTVRRATDGHFIHANIDTDVIFADELEGCKKPEEIYHIIEHFCLGRRRIELFGEDHNLRDGWLTLGRSLSSTNFDADKYVHPFTSEKDGHLLGSTPEIEKMRPKSPPPNAPRGQ